MMENTDHLCTDMLCMEFYIMLYINDKVLHNVIHKVLHNVID